MLGKGSGPNRLKFDPGQVVTIPKGGDMAPRVVLAGHNVDTDALAGRISGQSESKAGALSPETLSAAYARISRDPRDVPELRSDSRIEVDRARKSNRAIIFQMGHASVAEHSMFNLDVMDLSRLAVEALEHHRLASYTEKSQRYIRLEGDHVVPEEIASTEHEPAFREHVKKLGNFYKELAEKLTRQAKAEAKQGEKQSAIEARANEDARYALPLCASAQLGMTVNARTLELMIARTASHPLAEVRQLSQELYKAVEHIASSVVRYTEPTEYFRDTPKALAQLANSCLPDEHSPDTHAVTLVKHTPDPDKTVASGLLFASGDCSWATGWDTANSLDDKKTNELFAEVYKRMNLWDQLPRSFELVDFTFDVVLSAACFAQLKRHRMASLIPQPYSPELGRTIPESVSRAGMEEAFISHMERAEKLYHDIYQQVPMAAPYALTNAHRRRVLFRINGRSLGHFCRLRCDHEAQWDIRDVAKEMIMEAKKVMPKAGAFYGGKDRFGQLRTDLGL